MDGEHKLHRAVSVSRKEMLAEGSDAQFRDLIHLFFAFSSDLNNLRSEFSDYIGLSPTQYMVLITISNLEGRGAGITEIADRLYLSSAFVTIEVNRLVELGLVDKTAHKTDRRRVQLAPTEQGLQQLNLLAVIQQPVNDALFADISSKEFHELLRLLQLLVRNSGNARKLVQYLKSK